MEWHFEVALSDGSDLVAKEMEFGQGWNSPSHIMEWTFCVLDASQKFQN